LESVRELGLPLGRRLSPSTFPETENPDDRQNPHEPS
jgi:hypothetical protein